MHTSRQPQTKPLFPLVAQPMGAGKGYIHAALEVRRQTYVPYTLVVKNIRYPVVKSLEQ